MEEHGEKIVNINLSKLLSCSQEQYAKYTKARGITEAQGNLVKPKLKCYLWKQKDFSVQFVNSGVFSFFLSCLICLGSEEWLV